MASSLDLNKVQASLNDLSQAFTAAAIELGAIPDECHMECTLEEGPDGEPAMVCKLVCDF